MRDTGQDRASAIRVAIGARRPIRAVKDNKNGASRIIPGMRRTIPKRSSGAPPLPSPLFVLPEYPSNKKASTKKAMPGTAERWI